MNKNNKYKEMAIGFAVGIIANTLGVLIYILLFSDLGISDSLKAAVEAEHLGSLLALGAVLNLVAFFGFLKIRRDERARGVLLATVLTALVILYYKIFAG
jgi:4-amino-4-deoxy-L-arabinose transferase-like glycosyltransferase